ncbi:MAG: hypothetical protein IPG71_03425 [bacterium]|nr:hypothetical protein [bacterium]
MILILLLLVIYTESARADTLFVDTTQQLSQVIAEALPGDVLILDAGTHVGPIIPYSKPLTIGSRYL